MSNRFFVFFGVFFLFFLLFSDFFIMQNCCDAKILRVGLVLDKGGKDDQSFNSSAYSGLMRAKEELKAVVKYVEPADENSFESFLRSFAQKDFDLVVSIGVSQIDALKKVSAQFPKKLFMIVDGKVEGANVRSVVFEEHEGSFVVGAIAGWTSKSKVIGFIGGMDIPLIQRFGLGYAEGARYADKKVKVISRYVGVTADSWNNPGKAKELAIAQYREGVDVIYGAAGGSQTGIFDAAEEGKGRRFAIGIDSNQNWIKPGVVLTSMVKRLDNAVFRACLDVSKGSFSGGVERYNLANGGVDYTLDQYNKDVLTPEVRRKANDLKAAIIAGKIQVPDYYKIKK